ncbi:response regulator [uncultured Eubacterium sp.]|uniref:LytR/AlgR family response regulator transcription factor n=1 Tax=uncultured Eubacterium sp. TaxID=165185 RepID=UPI0026000CAD|nr:response regulator [uncultured Eubacterium sp.]
MNYVLVDDEERALNLLRIMLTRYDGFSVENDRIDTFTQPAEALDFIRHTSVDVIFLDIEMPVLNGIALGKQISQELDNPPEIIYVTAFPEYSLEAWDTDALGYILKPYDPKQISAVLNRVLKYHTTAVASLEAKNSLPPEDHIHTATAKETGQPHEQNSSLPHVRCFPDFELFINETPVSFKSRKAKELLALLVHYEGNWVPIDKITFCLLENCEEHSSKNYSRTILYRLKQTLTPYQLEQMVESAYGKMRVHTEHFTCDYYDYLHGQADLFQGDYMGEYTWAETTRAAMWAKMIKEK